MWRCGCDVVDVTLWMWRCGCDLMDVTLWMWPYGCDVWNAHRLTIYFPIKFYQNSLVVMWNGSECHFDIEKTVWNGFECFQDGGQIALISMVMRLIHSFRHFPLVILHFLWFLNGHIQSAVQLMPLIHPFTHTFTHTFTPCKAPSGAIEG